MAKYFRSREQRAAVQEKHISSIIENMDLKDIIAFATDCLHDQLDKLSDAELVEDISSSGPAYLKEIMNVLIEENGE